MKRCRAVEVKPHAFFTSALGARQHRYPAAVLTGTEAF